jgi:hypothetical protein
MTKSPAAKLARGLQTFAIIMDCHMSTTIRKARVLGLAALLVAGCTPRQLVPEAPLQAQNAGIRVSADTEAWDGAASVPLELTAVKLTVRNDSGRPVYFARSDVALRAESRELRALSPDTLEPHPVRTTLGIEPGTPWAPPPVPPAPINDLAMQQSGQRDAPAANALQGFAYREPSLPNGDQYGDPAQAEIREAALWDGVIASGEEASGFVYFDRLPKVDRLDLQVTLRSAPGGKPVLQVTIPYRVQR